jgi:hypothetical protein
LIIQSKGKRNVIKLRESKLFHPFRVLFAIATIIYNNVTLSGLNNPEGQCH